MIGDPQPANVLDVQPNLLAHWPELRPVRDETDVEFIRRAAANDKHQALFPTHYVERQTADVARLNGSRIRGEIIGAAGIGRVPLLTLWLHSAEVRPRETCGLLNVIENSLRLGGAPFMAAVVDLASPFLGVAERLGYERHEGKVLFTKRL